MNKELRNIAGGGMNLDDAPDLIQSPDYIEAWNLRTTGTSQEDALKGTNIESAQEIPRVMPGGINKGLGITGFPDARKLYSFVFNSQGYHQLLEVDVDSNTVSVLFTNLTDSAGVNILPLSSNNNIDDIALFNGEYLAWTDGGTPHLLSLKRLKSGAISPLIEEDLSLIKPQTLRPATGVYISDTGRSSNLLYGKLFQFITQRIGYYDDYSAWSTISKRIIPQQESTPTVTVDVSKNNAIIVYVNAGNSRTRTIRIGARYNDLSWFVIKQVERSYITSLTNTTINTSTEAYEAYDPATNTYSFLFYNDGLYEPISEVETDLAYDDVPLSAGSLAQLNSNIICLGDIKEGYPLPKVKATFKSVSYQPDLQIVNNTNANPFRISSTYSSGSGSGLGNHKRLLRVIFTGVPRTGDTWKITLYDIRDINQTVSYQYTVKSTEDGYLDGVVGSSAPIIPWNSVISPRVSATETGFEFRGDPYYEILSASITLFNKGSGVTRSVSALKSNSSYQAAISYRDRFGRYFPLVTGNDFIFKTASYAQTLGGSPTLQWNIQEAAPEGAVDYQILLSKNTSHQSTLYINGAVINYKGPWDAKNNSPALKVNEGTVGDTYIIIQPKTGDSQTNLGGNSSDYQSGDFVVYNGLSWDVISKDKGDLSSTLSYLYFKINPLVLFNRKNSQVGNSVLNYDFSQGDRITFAYYTTDNNTKTWFNSPTVDVQVEGYDASTQILKVRASQSLSPTTLAGKDVLMELYTPLKRTDVSDDNSADNNASTIFYEIGERYAITDGKHDKLTGNITGGDVYYKSREYAGAVDPNKLFTFAVEEFNFSDFYPSNFTSYGRPRTVFDTLEATEKKACIRYSDVFVLGSRNNGLTRFYPNRIYGEGAGETSSSKGAIRKLYQRGNVLMVIQDTCVGYIQVYGTILTDQAEQEQIAASSRLFDKIRYNPSDIGIGTGKSTFAVRDSNCFFIDTNRAEPVRAGLDGVSVISGKVSKFFKKRIKEAVMAGYGLSGYYDDYNEEYIVSIQTNGDVVQDLSFAVAQWKTLDDYNVPAFAISIISQPQNGSVAYNSSNGMATYTSNSNYTGGDSFTYGFSVNGHQVTKKECGQITAGTTSINQFKFNDVPSASLSSYYISNSIFIIGNNVPVPISITGGEYSVNQGDWKTVAGMVNPNDDVRVRVMSSGQQNMTVSATLTVSDESDTYDVTSASVITTVNYKVVEPSNPYADANLRILLNGVEVRTINGNEESYVDVSGGGTLRFQFFSEIQSTGFAPTLTGVVTTGPLQELFNQTKPIPADGQLVFFYDAPTGGVLNVSSTAAADNSANAPYRVFNDFSNNYVAYRLTSDSDDTGILSIQPSGVLDAEQAFNSVSGSNATLFVYAPTDYTVARSIPDNQLQGQSNNGGVLFNRTLAQIQQEKQNGITGMRVSQGANPSPSDPDPNTGGEQEVS